MTFPRAFSCLAVVLAKEHAPYAVSISLARRSFSVGGCSITEDVRKYAAEQGIRENEALEMGLKEKSREFFEKGSAVYAKP